MKCLSVKNPFSYLLCAGIKDVENRTWSTNYRGQLFIHSTISENKTLSISSEMTPIIEEAYFGTNVSKDHIHTPKNGIELKHMKINENGKIDITDKNNLETKLMKFISCSKHEFQCILGSVDLVGVIKDSNSKWAEPGNFHWILKNPKLFLNPKLFVKGKLSIWEYPDEEISESINLSEIDYFDIPNLFK